MRGISPPGLRSLHPSSHGDHRGNVPAVHSGGRRLRARPISRRKYSCVQHRGRAARASGAAIRLSPAPPTREGSLRRGDPCTPLLRGGGHPLLPRCKACRRVLSAAAEVIRWAGGASPIHALHLTLEHQNSYREAAWRAAARRVMDPHFRVQEAEGLMVVTPGISVAKTGQNPAGDHDAAAQAARRLLQESRARDVITGDARG